MALDTTTATAPSEAVALDTATVTALSEAVAFDRTTVASPSEAVVLGNGNGSVRGCGTRTRQGNGKSSV